MKCFVHGSHVLKLFTEFGRNSRATFDVVINKHFDLFFFWSLFTIQFLPFSYFGNFVQTVNIIELCIQ